MVIKPAEFGQHKFRRHQLRSGGTNAAFLVRGRWVLNDAAEGILEVAAARWAEGHPAAFRERVADPDVMRHTWPPSDSRL